MTNYNDDSNDGSIGRRCLQGRSIFCCGSTCTPTTSPSSSNTNYSRRFCGRCQHRQKEVLRRMTHRERLRLVSLYSALGWISLLVGSGVGMGIVWVACEQIEWSAQDSTLSAALLGWGVGMGLALALVLIVAESRRHFSCATAIQTLDQELQETDTIGTQEDDELILEWYANNDEEQEEGDNDDGNVDTEIIVDGYDSNGEEQV